jgi:integrase
MVADGTITVEQFWDRVHWPVLSRSLAPNSQKTYRTAWNKWIRPSIGKIELQRVSKNAVEVTLSKMAGMGEHTVRICRVVISSLFTEAVENGFIQINPARKVRLPRHKPTEETAPLTESEVRRLFAATNGQDRLLWMLLILLGLRISEVLALKKDDITEDGYLRVDQSAHRGEGDLTKNRKKRRVPLPEILRIELDEWARQQPGEVLFPREDGRMHDRNDNPTRAVQQRGREAAQLPRLTFRCCRTTFATLFDGDPRDLQEFLGHSTMQMTSRYRKARAERQAAAVEAMAVRLSEKVVPISRKQKAGAGTRT